MMTISFKIIIGGIKEDIKKEEFSEKELTDLWINISQDISKELKQDVFIPIDIMRVTSLQDKKWDKPDNTNDKFILTGTANPDYIKNTKKYKEVIVLYAKAIQKLRWVSLEFSDIDLINLEN